MYVPIMHHSSESNYRGSLPHRNDNNPAVQDLLDHEIQRRTKYNNSFLARLFGKSSVDRAEVLKYFKSLRPMEDDRYFLASRFNASMK